MSAAKFLQLLMTRGMLDDATVAKLQQQVSDRKRRVTAESIAKVLVEQGHLTKYQATKLVGEVTTGAETVADVPSPAGQDSAAASPPESDAELGLAPE